MSKYETVRRKHCVGCGNPWFFFKEKTYDCTTCYEQFPHSKLDNELQEENNKAADLRATMESKFSKPV